MSARQYCGRKGLLVGEREAMLGQGERPPSEQEVAAGRVVGCHHLRCNQCGARVVSFAARMWSPALDLDDLAGQYDRGELERSLVVNEFSDRYRAYACRCHIRMQAGSAVLGEMALDTDFPWECAGHDPPFSGEG